MDKEEFYYHFCSVMRRCGNVKLKNIAAIANVSVPKARTFLDELLEEGKIRKEGESRATVYVFP
jgi:predicted transcriptional regulator